MQKPETSQYSRVIVYNDIPRAFPPGRKQKFVMRAMIWFGVCALIGFVSWFFTTSHVGYLPLYIPLTGALVFKLLRMLHEWYHYYKISIPEPPKRFKSLSVDMFTTACPGEPVDMIVNTLKAMISVRYPHKSYLCDEGNNPYLKQVCEELGVIHVTRTVKIDAKAGNINNALKYANGDLCVVLDPDHVPHPDFLDRVVSYFEDPEVGYVQCVQGYGNQKESLVALGAAEQTYHFYGPMMMCMNSYRTVQAIGANCTFRREALDSIGGHAAGLSEDMHTAMQIHAKGWKTLYVPEMLTKGLVPTSLSAYYKQQLKWSRGTFDLLFHVYPKLFKSFTWRQKLHYLTLPMYFSVGFFSLIDIFIPIIALFTSEIPWLVDFGHFALIFTGLLGISVLIRLYAQNWVLEKQERGLHLIGGILRHGTWWIYILGFIYTILNVKVPYIPTPKDDEPENSWKLASPNLALSIISVSALIYGLSIDWSPYSFFMASFAGINSLMLATAFFISQQKFLIACDDLVSKLFDINLILSPLKKMASEIKQAAYFLIRKSALGFSCFFAVVFITGFFEIRKSETLSNLNNGNITKEYGAFYIGKHYGYSELEEIKSENLRKNVKSFDIKSFDLEWKPITRENFPDEFIRTCYKEQALPLINWLPETNEFDEYDKNNSFSKSLQVLSAIYNHKFDFYLDDFCKKMRELKYPVMINFAPEPDNPANSWSARGGNTPEDFVKAWQYVVTYFIEKGVYNVTWVWNPWKPSAVNAYYPGEHYVDWIGVSILNEAKSEEEKFLYSFEALYDPFYRQFEKNTELRLKPVMINRLGTLTEDSSGNEWYKEVFNSIKNNYKEIRSVIFFNGEKKYAEYSDFGITDNERIYSQKFKASASEVSSLTHVFSEAPFNERLKFTYLEKSENVEKLSKKYIKGSPGNFSLFVDEKPYYVKGIADNPGHDWRDGNWPLTRKQLVSDLSKIKEAGANTIRRYSPGFYDENILNVSDEFDLKVLYGFWFDPEKDYCMDDKAKEKYRKQIMDIVNEYKEHPSVLAWSIGNETWGLLKHHFAEPYLTLVRIEYMKMIEEYTRMIHGLDPERPVFTACEHSWKLSTELGAWHDNAPSLDIISINSYYEEQISKLNKLTWKQDSVRPYLISEFGPRGYWNPELSRYKNDTLLIEDSDYEKAQTYSHEWKDYVLANKGNNIGGVAYCWRDRMEGSNTWFGLVDYKGRPKPVYHALKEQWVGNNSQNIVADYVNMARIIPLEKENISATEWCFTVNHKYVKGNSCKYEWYLNREEFLEKAGEIEVRDNGKKVWVKLPDEYSKYRLYVYVSDEFGNVSTASMPLRNNIP